MFIVFKVQDSKHTFWVIYYYFYIRKKYYKALALGLLNGYKLSFAGLSLQFITF